MQSEDKGNPDINLLDKVYSPADVEKKWYSLWEDKNYFSAGSKGGNDYFSIVIPPPNVTGVLHMGHALNNTIQDILVRYKRMCGLDTLWIPGTDHAGIATQNVVEVQLKSQDTSKEEIGRDKFIERVWDWKEKSGGHILTQLKRLGSSCDWPKERFTMDEGLSAAVTEVFVKLYEEGLIYKDNYMVNWCPRCLTALSDLEVEHEEKYGSLYYFRYPVKGTTDFITIATTRPETMLGDTAVAVHPDDSRFSSSMGKSILLPLANREIPVIADERVDKEFGTGAVKITPAHDPNDFEIGQKHGLDSISIMDKQANMNEHAGPYAGLDRFACRKKIIEDLDRLGLYVKTEEQRHAVGECYRCKTIIEPMVSPQWFVRVMPLAKPAIEAVKSKKVKFFPKLWENSYFDWMENIKDWCISRQIWWGHQIPAWYCDDCEEIIVARKEPSCCPRCDSTKLTRETDVLDTWFSSALWPFSTLGWPEKTDLLKRFYPTSTLVTGFDIIFFWVARMMMMGIKFMGEPPFNTIYIHALVRDSHGQKMSKSRGNVIDPIAWMDQYGTDTLRFTFAAMASPGRDIKLSEERVVGYRNFINKVWNAARFILMTTDDAIRSSSIEDITHAALSSSTLHDSWMFSMLSEQIDKTRSQIESYRFDEAANGLYKFFWHEFCDWFIELGKVNLNVSKDDDTNRKAPLVYTLEILLRLLHPFIPFVTEEIWQKIPHKGESIVTSQYPSSHEIVQDKTKKEEMDLVISVISTIRLVRNEAGIPNSKKTAVLIKTSKHICSVLEENSHYILTLAKLESMQTGIDVQPGETCASGVINGVSVFIPLEGVLDTAEEKSRLTKEIKKEAVLLGQLQKKLANKDFVEKAPQSVVEKNLLKKQLIEDKIKKLKENLGRL